MANNHHIETMNKKNLRKARKDDLLENDLVVIRDWKNQEKLKNKWYGPFRVLRTKANGTCDVQSMETGLRLVVGR